MDPFCSREAFGRTIFYESEKFMALHDIKPVVLGHVLIVPKRHVLDLLELDNSEKDDMRKAFDIVVPKVLEMYRASENSYDITLQVGPYSGRSVPHLHAHIIPRRKDDVYQRDDKNIYEDIKLNTSAFSLEDVDREVGRLRNEFKYAQGTL